MFELIAAKLGGAVSVYAIQMVSYGVFGMAILYIMKRIPNDKIKLIVRNTFLALGVTTTLGMSRYKYTKKIWNKFMEPYFVDLINNTVVEGARAYIEGMRSDNE